MTIIKGPRQVFWRVRGTLIDFDSGFTRCVLGLNYVII